MTKKYLALVTSLVLGAVIFNVPTVAQAETISPEECYPAVLMLKGSGEGQVDGEPVDSVTYSPKSSPSTPFITTNGHEGAVLGRLLQAFVDQTDPSETVSKVRFIGIEYPALPVFPELPHPLNTSVMGLDTLITNHVLQYNESYRVGAQMTLDFIKKDEQRGCNTQYMLLSYSQGVISARLTMNLLDNNTDKVISSYVIGDPFQKAGGATSSRQKTAANTSSDTAGIGIVASNSFIMVEDAFIVPISKWIVSKATESIKAYRDEMSRSDPVIYRDEGEGNIVSRTLCHQNDPTCGYSGIETSDIEQHVNYYLETEPAGALDLELEVAEFDKQVQMLANSTTHDPRERTLTKTPALLGETITYSVANARPDDKCTWDEGSDGTRESVAVSCEFYDVTPDSEVAKMTVTVTDSFGITHTLGSEVKTIDPKAADILTSLDPNTWYQFKPLQNPYAGDYDEEYYADSCIGVRNPYDDLIDEEEPKRLDFIASCGEIPAEYVAERSTTAFRPAKYTTSQEEETRILWGYDDRYALSTQTYNIAIQPVSDDSTQNITPRLAQIIDGVPYYVFQQGNLCIAPPEYPRYHITTLPCDFSDEDQLFSVMPLSDQYGDLSIERDETPPTPVTWVRAEVDYYGASLKWEESTDVRTPFVDYYIYKMDNDTGDYHFVGKQPYWRGYSATNYELDIDSMNPGETHTYKVVAGDLANNMSEPGFVTFQTPPYLSHAPEYPDVWRGPETEIALSFYTEPFPSFKSVRIYRQTEGEEDWHYIATTTENYYIDQVSPDELYSYKYQVEIADNVFTNISSESSPN